MVNKALYVTEMKNSWKLLLIFCLILTMYTTIMLTMFDPSLGSALDEFAKMMPEIMSMVGMNGSTATLVHFLSTYLYGMLMIVFPFLFTVLLSLKYIAKKVDNGSMAYLLSSEISSLPLSHCVHLPDYDNSIPDHPEISPAEHF